VTCEGLQWCVTARRKYEANDMKMASICLQDDGAKEYQKKKRSKRRSGDEVVAKT
jgi:hypothetical protein